MGRTARRCRWVRLPVHGFPPVGTSRRESPRGPTGRPCAPRSWNHDALHPPGDGHGSAVGGRRCCGGRGGMTGIGEPPRACSHAAPPGSSPCRNSAGPGHSAGRRERPSRTGRRRSGGGSRLPERSKPPATRCWVREIGTLIHWCWSRLTFVQPSGRLIAPTNRASSSAKVLVAGAFSTRAEPATSAAEFPALSRREPDPPSASLGGNQIQSRINQI